jgi:hypothetical protein
MIKGLSGAVGDSKTEEGEGESGRSIPKYNPVGVV